MNDTQAYLVDAGNNMTTPTPGLWMFRLNTPCFIKSRSNYRSYPRPGGEGGGGPEGTELMMSSVVSLVGFVSYGVWVHQALLPTGAVMYMLIELKWLWLS